MPKITAVRWSDLEYKQEFGHAVGRAKSHNSE